MNNPNRWDVPSINMNTFLTGLHHHFPRFVFTGGLNDRGRYCIFVYDTVERGTDIPAEPHLAAIETEGSSEEAINVLYTKISLLHG